MRRVLQILTWRFGLSIYPYHFLAVSVALTIFDYSGQRAESKLAEFLIRTQVNSTVHPELSGAWFRAFDYDAWEYWASDNDWGYGPWTTETGWSNGWIMTALAAREGNTTVGRGGSFIRARGYFVLVTVGVGGRCWLDC